MFKTLLGGNFKEDETELFILLFNKQCDSTLHLIESFRSAYNIDLSKTPVAEPTEETVQCVICHETANDDVVTHCKHYYCSACINR